MHRYGLCAVLCWSLCRTISYSPTTAAGEIDVSRLPAPRASAVDYTADVQPLLQKTCYSCHGPDMQEAGLRLDLKERALQGGDSGKAIIPGDSAASRLIHRVGGLDEELGIMPPEGEGTPLTAEQISLLRAWIDQGAAWPDQPNDAAKSAGGGLWSLRPPVWPAVPVVSNPSWVLNPIDAFVLERLDREGIAPSPPAGRTTLLRRLYLDLLGLLPPPEEVAEFLADSRPDAYERLVDRLLSSPAFGERWGRHWLDLARYADSDGYEKDRPRPFAWRYRDWVIAAINADMPYDEFSVEQIAGDLLPQAGLAERIAVGFHRNTLHNTEGGIDPEEDRVKKTIDRTNTLGTVWLGLTVGCAQCHSHKYDPLTQREYYQLYAFFNNLDETDVEAPLAVEQQRYERARAAFEAKHAPYVEAVRRYETEGLLEAQAAWEKTVLFGPCDAAGIPSVVVEALRVDPANRSAEQTEAISAYYREQDPQLKKLQAAVEEHAKKAPKPPAMKAQSVARCSELRPTQILVRGDFLNPGDEVQPSGPAWLPPITPRGERADRLDLAAWLMSAENPLPARVAVNRWWEKIFGRGIVRTVDDFGKQGELPTHAELLDWLALELRQSGWSTKHVLRLIVTSNAYRQSSAIRTDLLAIDPENALLARQSRRRVEAELIRDLSLAASGLLDCRVGGPSVRPPQPPEYTKLTYANSAKWPESTGGDRYRRGLYTFFQRTSPYPMLMTFDSPDSTECCAMRESSNTPLQALTLWNDPTFFECAQSLARRVVADVPPGSDERRGFEDRLAYAFARCLGRPPEASERKTLAELFADQLAHFGAAPAAAEDAAGRGELPPGTSVAEVAAWTVVSRVLLNLDEFITRE